MGHTQTVFIKPPKVAAGFGVLLFGCKAAPIDTFFIVHGHTQTMLINQTQLALSLGHALFGGLLVPEHGVFRAGRYAAAIGEGKGQVVLRKFVALIGR